MSRTANADFQVTTWDQEPYEGVEDGPELGSATAVKRYTGDLEGEGRARVLLCRAREEADPKNAGFVASEQFVGRIHGREGSFAMQFWGFSAAGIAPWTAGHVVPGSGTGELEGLSGAVEVAVAKDGRHTLSVEYVLPSESEAPA